MFQEDIRKEPWAAACHATGFWGAERTTVCSVDVEYYNLAGVLWPSLPCLLSRC